jgi:AraC-like DNA-binding protein
MSIDVGRISPDIIKLASEPWLNTDVSPEGLAETTDALQRQAVERVILRMRDQLDTPLTLGEMAEIAHLSRFHFNRVFTHVTGVSPRKFLATLRLEYAKRLLLTSDLSITEVCFETGYSSLGTFTSHFTTLVGVTPKTWRKLPSEMNMSMEEVMALLSSMRSGPGMPGFPVTGRVTAPEGFHGVVFIGLFKSNIPQSDPCTGTILFGDDSYGLPAVPDGTYYALAVAIDAPLDPINFFIPDTMLRGRSGAITVNGGLVEGTGDLELRPARLIDPPILIALPYLFVRYLAMTAEGMAQPAT